GPSVISQRTRQTKKRPIQEGIQEMVRMEKVRCRSKFDIQGIAEPVIAIRSREGHLIQHPEKQEENEKSPIFRFHRGSDRASITSRNILGGGRRWGWIRARTSTS